MQTQVEGNAVNQQDGDFAPGIRGGHTTWWTYGPLLMGVVGNIVLLELPLPPCTRRLLLKVLSYLLKKILQTFLGRLTGFEELSCLIIHVIFWYITVMFTAEGDEAHQQEGGGHTTWWTYGRLLMGVVVIVVLLQLPLPPCTRRPLLKVLSYLLKKILQTFLRTLTDDEELTAFITDVIFEVLGDYLDI